jgi:hypothetical protein
MSILNELKEDLSNLHQILLSYGELLKKESIKDISVGGKTIQYANQEQASLFSYYDQIRVELETICDYIDLKCREVKAASIKSILKNSEKSYGERILEKMVDENPKFIDIQKKLIKAKEMYLLSKSIVQSIEHRGYALNNITKIKVAAIEETILYE